MPKNKENTVVMNIVLSPESTRRLKKLNGELKELNALASELNKKILEINIKLPSKLAKGRADAG